MSVILLCGASGVGKSRAAAALAARYGVPLGEADDIVTALSAMTTPEQQPVLHRWAADPSARSWLPAQIADFHFQMAAALRPAFGAVIADHLAYEAPAIMEGDYLTPALCRPYSGRVVAVVLEEPSEDQLVANYLSREPAAGEQRTRAQVSVLVGTRLVAQAREVGMPVVAARRWDDQLDRIDRALHAWVR